MQLLRGPTLCQRFTTYERLQSWKRYGDGLFVDHDWDYPCGVQNWENHQRKGRTGWSTCDSLFWIDKVSSAHIQWCFTNNHLINDLRMYTKYSRRISLQDFSSLPTGRGAGQKLVTGSCVPRKKTKFERLAIFGDLAGTPETSGSVKARHRHSSKSKSMTRRNIWDQKDVLVAQSWSNGR